MMHALRGALYYCVNNPFLYDPAECAVYESDGVLLIDNGQIEAVGAYDALRDRLDDVPVTHYPDELIVPGFIDAHLHFPQVEIIGSYGEQLLEWLNKYTFPAEGRFRDRDHADRIAEFFIQELLRNGTTAASVFCTVAPESVNALFTVAERYNMRLSAGKNMMNRNAPDYLTDTVQSSYDDSKTLLERWHNRGRLLYCVTPRFAITSTAEQLEAASALFHEYDDVLLQSHISENLKEIETVKGLFPEHATYTDVYDHFNLLDERTIYGHAIHMSDDEFRRFHETGATIAHCPTSNTFIGSGLFNLLAATDSARPVRVGLGTDIGGGTSFSMLQTLGEAYKVQQLRGDNLGAMQGFYLATLGSAESLYLDDRIGTFAPGYEADITILDPKATSLLALRSERCDTIDELLFVLMTIGDDRAVKATYIAGEKAYSRDGQQN
jgi:guanine deaminase